MEVQRAGIKKWLLDPTHAVTSQAALIVGVAGILLAALVGDMSHTHFDGVLDVHTGRKARALVFILEGFIDWAALSGALWLLATRVGKVACNTRDLFSYQALARAPALLIALFCLLPGYRRYASHLAFQHLGGISKFTLQSGDVVFFWFVVLITLLMIIWMVYLMYRAFTQTCGVSGGTAAGLFIAGMIAAEIVAKIAVIGVIRLFR